MDLDATLERKAHYSESRIPSPVNISILGAERLKIHQKLFPALLSE